MGNWRVVLALGVLCGLPARGAAQDAGPEVPATAVEADASVEAAPPEAPPPDAEPLPETPPGYGGTAVPAPPAQTGRAPRPTVVAPAADPAAVAPAPDPAVELALTINGLLSFSGTTTPVLVANADLVFALDPRAWIGLGIAFSYSEQHTTPSPGIPDMKFVTSSFSLPLIFQYYFDPPHVGAAVPTLRVQLTPGWSESPVGAPVAATQVVTGNATLLAGVTWLATHWLALRIIGGVSGGFGVNVVGPINITGNAAVMANVALVIRF